MIHRLNPGGLLVACLLLGANGANAGRPLQTEDAGVIDAGGCELEGSRLQTKAGADKGAESGLGLGCGIGLRSQVGLGYANTRADGQTAQTAELAGKTWLWRGEGDGAAALTLAWSASALKLPGAGWKHDSSELNLVAGVPLDGATLHLNLGHARELPSRLVATTWGLAWERDEAPAGGLGWAPMAEFFGDDHGAAWWNLATRLTVLPGRLFFDLSYGQRWQGGNARLVTAGFKFAF